MCSLYTVTQIDYFYMCGAQEPDSLICIKTWALGKLYDCDSPKTVVLDQSKNWWVQGISGSSLALPMYAIPQHT